jgi:hypothetical protein
MEEAPDLYEKPLSERQPVNCVDAKPVALHASAVSSRRRCGALPWPRTKPTPNRSSLQLADSPLEMVARYPEADTMPPVLDNSCSITGSA